MRLRVRVHAKPVNALLLPGITTSAVEWDDVVPRFASRLAVLDHRGRGESDAPKTSYSISELAADTAAVIRALGSPLNVIGHSQGAHVALRLAILHPELVRRVVAIDPPPRWGAPPWSIDDEWARSRLRIFAATPGDREALVRAMHPAFTSEQVVRRATMLGRIREDVFRRSLLPDPDFELLRDAPSVRAPVLLITGREPRGGMPAAAARRLAAALPSAGLVTLDSGHDIHLDDPDGLLRAVDDFLRTP